MIFNRSRVISKKPVNESDSSTSLIIKHFVFTTIPSFESGSFLSHRYCGFCLEGYLTGNLFFIVMQGATVLFPVVVNGLDIKIRIFNRLNKDTRIGIRLFYPLCLNDV